MASQPNAPDLTTRDIFLQVDRRLTLIEEDVRTLDQKVDGLDDKLDVRIDRLDGKLDTRMDKLDGKLDTRMDILALKIDTGLGEVRKEMSAKFLWVLGVVLASWISTIGTVLFK